jgi:hypothetical protein
MHSIFIRVVKYYIMSRDSSVSVAMGYGPMIQDFSLLHCDQTDSGAHPASYQMGTGGKAAGAWNCSLSYAEVKKGGAISPLPICRHGIVHNWLSTGTALPNCYIYNVKGILYRFLEYCSDIWWLFNAKENIIRYYSIVFSPVISAVA